MIIEKARQLREVIETVSQNLSDEAAYYSKELYPLWSGDSVNYDKGLKVRYKSKLFKVITAHTSQETWNPEDAPSLFAEILNPEGEEFPEWKQPGSTNTYMKGDKVTHGGKKWISLVDVNVWEPGIYGWEEI